MPRVKDIGQPDKEPKLCPGECKAGSCYFAPVISEWLKLEDPYRAEWLVITKAISMSDQGIAYHPDMAGNSARIRGYVERGVNHNYPGVGQFSREQVLSMFADCIAQQCVEERLPRG